MIIAAIILAGIMGMTLGLLGGGGSILTVPILVYVLEQPEKTAIATSLLVVGLTSVFALIPHARQGHVMWKFGALFGFFGMIGAFLGGQLAQFVPGQVLLVLFALLMAPMGVMMWRGREEKDTEDDSPHIESFWMVAIEGILVGAVTGLVGAGGGFLVVPALVMLAKMPIKRAVGTSLLVVAMKSFGGFLGFATHVTLDGSLILGFGAAAVVGSLVGAQLSSKLPAQKLRRAFALFVGVMAAFILSKELGVLTLLEHTSRQSALLLALLVGGLLGALGATLYFKARERRLHPS